MAQGEGGSHYLRGTEQGRSRGGGEKVIISGVEQDKGVGGQGRKGDTGREVLPEREMLKR